MPLGNSNINPSQNFKVNVAITASAASNSVFNGSILQNQTDTTGVTVLNVPPNQIWKITDSYISATSSGLAIDLIVDIWVDNTPQNINWDANSTNLALGTTRINAFAYMTNGGLLVGATSSIQVKVATQSAATTNATTESLYLVVVQYPIKK